MELSDSRLPDEQIGVEVGRGRDAVILALGSDRVVRRTIDAERDHIGEAAVMEHVRAAGYPVPRVHRVAPGEMVLDRIDGPTLLDDLTGHPWRVRGAAGLLVELHDRLHRIEAPSGLRPHPVPGRAVLHQDLHPGNVLLSPDGPVVIDWTNACRGDQAADVALTWLLMATSELEDEPLPPGLLDGLGARVVRRATPALRRYLTHRFLAGAGRDEARRVLAAVAAVRLADRNVLPAEAVAISALVARELGPSPAAGT